MASKGVDIHIKARDEASAAFKSASKSAESFSSSIRGLAAAFGAYIGMREIYGFTKSSVEEFGKLELAINNLSTALAINGLAGDGAMEDYKNFTDIITQMTTADDDLTYEMLKMGVSIGHLSGVTLKNAVTAAHGLSKAYGMDLPAAMRLLSRAAAGEVGELSKQGIYLDETLTPMQAFFELIEKGTENFKLATAEVDTFSGSMKQLGKEWDDLKRKIGEPIANEILGVMDLLRGKGTGFSPDDWNGPGFFDIKGRKWWVDYKDITYQFMQETIKSEEAQKEKARMLEEEAARIAAEREKKLAEEAAKDAVKFAEWRAEQIKRIAEDEYRDEVSRQQRLKSLIEGRSLSPDTYRERLITRQAPDRLQLSGYKDKADSNALKAIENNTRILNETMKGWTKQQITGYRDKLEYSRIGR